MIFPGDEDMTVKTKNRKKRLSKTFKKPAETITPETDLIVDVPNFIEPPPDEACMYKFLDIDFSWEEIQSKFRGRWRRRFTKTFRSLSDAVLLAIPDCEGVELIDDEIRRVDERLREDSRSAIVGQLLKFATGDGENIPTECRSLAQIAMAYFLPETIKSDPETAKQFLRSVEVAMQMRLDQSDARPLEFICAAVELPLILSAALKKLERGHAIGTEAIETYGLFLERFFDAEGWIAPQHLRELGAVVASIVRCRKLIKLSKHIVPESIQNHFECICRQFARMTRADGQLLLADGWMSSPDIAIQAFKKLTTNRKDSRLFQFLLAPKKARKIPKNLIPSGNFSESARIGVLRCNWLRKSPRLALAIMEQRMVMEIGAEQSIVRGNSIPCIRLGSTEVEFGDGAFAVNIWHSDEDVECLELEKKIGEGVTWQRQFLVSREDNIIILVDAFFFNENHDQIEYSCKYPLAESTTLLEETETREVYFQHKEKITAIAIPFTQGEWIIDRSGNQTSAAGEYLEVFQKGRGRRLYVGLALSLDPKESVKPRTWRKLTVGEGLESANDEQAVAFRIQIGKSQWALYRNLATAKSRTFLGQNVVSDFCFGRFNSDGTFEKIIEIE